VPTTRGQHAGAKAVMSDNTPQTPLRIRIDVPLGTSYQEIRDSVLLQAWQLAGTQLRAAVALGIRPETVSRNLLRAERNRAVVSAAHPIIEGAASDPAIRGIAPSFHRFIGPSVAKARRPIPSHTPSR